ncbi:MAG: multiheme c-type cytochrome [Planctomycetota bacterium]
MGLVLWFTVLVLVSGGCGDDPDDVQETFTLPDVGEIKLETDTFTSAKVCGACHQAIHSCWQQSMHSRAFSNGVFQAAYRAATETYSQERSRMCLSCHAPTVQETQDNTDQDPMLKEGVTCDYCHSIRGLDLDGPKKLVDLTMGQTKYGPLKHAQSPIHEVVHSELHLSSKFCATCHEHRNQHGVAILETYSEWKDSPYAKEGTQCQDCHMPLIPGRLVALGLKKKSVGKLNLHDISGSHDLERIRQAVTMDILSVERLDSKKKVLVKISVTNVGSGHCFPTGLPKHMAALEVTLTDRGRMVGRRVIEFAKVLLNEKMIPITREEEMFLEASSIRSDTRLKPMKKRVVSATFYDVDVPEGLIEASLSYQYLTRMVTSEKGAEVIKPIEMKVLIASQKRRLPKRIAK